MLEGDLKSAGEKYSYVQQMRAYIADLCDCLAHKSALVEELEEVMISIWILSDNVVTMLYDGCVC